MIFTRLFIVLSLVSHTVWSFQASSSVSKGTRMSTTQLYNADKWSERSTGRMERLEYKIYPDGRVEEKVIGVKGGECQKVTEGIEKSLGKVVDTKPTEEMYEEKVVEKGVVNISAENGWEGTSTW